MPYHPAGSPRPFLFYAAALALCQGLLACHAAPQTRTYTVEVLVESTVGVPLAGAALEHAPGDRSRTQRDGMLRLALLGHEGDTTDLRIVCPEDYAQPAAALRVALRSLAQGSPIPRYRVLCPPRSHRLVVAVRAQHGANLPLRYRGREVARTDADGAAHVLLRVAPKDAVTLQLDTSGDAQLRPISPELRLSMPAHDEVVLFDKTFQREARRAAPTAHARRGPVPITAR